MMERWSGILNVPLHPGSEACYRVAASLRLTPLKTLQVPSANAIFFSGDRVEGTGNPVIERLSNLQRISEILVSKFGSSINAWVIEASTFNGPFAVYTDFLPSVNQWGEPRSYNPAGFPASSSIFRLLMKCLAEAKNGIRGYGASPVQSTITATDSTHPKTIILGFSKGGTVLNQLVTEHAFSEIKPNSNLPTISKNQVIPYSRESLLESITQIHFVDVGLNSAGAYLTDQDTIRKLSKRAASGDSCIQFMFHGTPRQWSDKRRDWIRREKDELVDLLKTESQASHGKLAVCERLYFGDKAPDLQMHFEIIEALDIH
uniref:Uncharacterized protein n=1 Tax=Kalanchoe fedtschenkoi TaxID=63787 RepID=A0A7N0UPI2_KALFE